MIRRPFIVAEIGGNHRGNPEWARKLVDAAADAGADGVKFQCFTPEQMIDSGTMIEQGPWHGWNAVELYRSIWTPRLWFEQLFARARKRGLVPFSSVFHRDDVDFLETLDCQIYKIASFELTDTDLIAHAAATGKPMMISTGMASFEEIEQACDAAFEGSPGPAGVNVTLLKCTSAYPAPIDTADLVMMKDMEERLIWLGPPDIGLSDHTNGSTVAIAATALGATVIEKHLILDRANGGPDAAFSAEPAEFAAMVKACKEAALAIGEVRYGPTPAEASSLQFRRKPGQKRGIA
jgi:N-acetylneuraminate synthase